ncbi:MAG: hypothetical protein JSU07_11320 [Bacteroidetes bacterium]|nr:hypothetical protein [Bacteroidota bacterium]
MQHNNPIKAGLSPHLFWDVNKETLDWSKQAALIIKRVLEYGLWNDWKIICKQYSVLFIAEQTMNFRDIEPKALHFIANVSETSLKQYRCYTTTRLTNQHWNF